MGGAIGLFLMLAFFAAQGGAIFATAFLCLRRLGADQRLNRLPAIMVSYAVWIMFTLIGYFMLGGEGGLMDGFGLVLMLCVTALISALVYAAVRSFVPSREREGCHG